MGLVKHPTEYGETSALYVSQVKHRDYVSSISEGYLFKNTHGHYNCPMAAI